MSSSGRSASQEKSIKKVRIRRQLVIPNLLKNYFVLTVNNSKDASVQHATHQDDTCKTNDGQFSCYRVCGNDNETKASHSCSKRACVLARRADVKEHVKCNSVKNSMYSSLEFVNTSCSSDSFSCNTSNRITKSKKMRTLSPELSNSCKRHSNMLGNTCNFLSIQNSQLSNNSTSSCSSPFMMDETFSCQSDIIPSNPETIQTQHVTTNTTNHSFLLMNSTSSSTTPSTCMTNHNPFYSKQELQHPLFQQHLFLQLNAVEIKEEWDKWLETELVNMFFLNHSLSNTKNKE